MDLVAPLFWGGSAVAIPAAFFAPGVLRWAAISWLAIVGVLFSLVNWAMAARTLLLRRDGSMIGPFGALFLGLAVAAFPGRRAARWSVLWILVADPWIAITTLS